MVPSCDGEQVTCVPARVYMYMYMYVCVANLRTIRKIIDGLRMSRWGFKKMNISAVLHVPVCLCVVSEHRRMVYWSIIHVIIDMKEAEDL